VPTSEAGFAQYFERLAPSQIALEAGMHSGWVSRLLQACGHTAVVANARELRKIHQVGRRSARCGVSARSSMPATLRDGIGVGELKTRQAGRQAADLLGSCQSKPLRSQLQRVKRRDLNR
jgi:hypothetical protein